MKNWARLASSNTKDRGMTDPRNMTATEIMLRHYQSGRTIISALVDRMEREAWRAQRPVCVLTASLNKAKM